MNKTAQRLAAEFAVIVMGVLVALAVDQWREGLRENALEAEYAARLLQDLRKDSARYADLLEDQFVTKRDFLVALSEGRVPMTAGNDPSLLLAHLDQSTWGGVVEVRDAAFREMESTGRLGLLNNPGTRSMLAEYYATHGFLSDRYYRSPGAYDQVAAEAVPGLTRYRLHTGESVDEQAVRAGIQALLADPRIGQAVNAELAYAGGLVQWYRSLLRRAVGLIERLEADYPR